MTSHSDEPTPAPAPAGAGGKAFITPAAWDFDKGAPRHPFPDCQTEGCCVGDCPACLDRAGLLQEVRRLQALLVRAHDALGMVFDPDPEHHETDVRDAQGVRDAILAELAGEGYVACEACGCLTRDAVQARMQDGTVEPHCRSCDGFAQLWRTVMRHRIADGRKP